MGWREIVFRVAVAIVWVLFGLGFLDTALHGEVEDQAMPRRIVWLTGAVVSFVAAPGIVAAMFLKGGQIRWLAPAKLSRTDWTGVAVLAGAGVSMFLAAQAGFIDLRPIWFRLQILWMTIVFVLWVVFSVTTDDPSSEA